MIGAGKYDDVCKEVREKTEAAGTIIIILDGNKGFGFSAQLPEEYAYDISKMLRTVADEIEKDVKNLSN